MAITCSVNLVIVAEHNHLSIVSESDDDSSPASGLFMRTVVILCPIQC